MHAAHSPEHYAALAARQGVPSMWLDDAAQDIAIATWIAGDRRPVVILRAAIDAARRYGPRDRRGRQRPEAVPLSLFIWRNDPDADPNPPPQLATDPWPAWERRQDVRTAWGRLTAQERRRLALVGIGAPGRGNGDDSARWAARRQLRTLIDTGRRHSRDRLAATYQPVG